MKRWQQKEKPLSEGGNSIGKLHVAGGNITGGATRAGAPVSTNEAVLDPTFTGMWGGMIKSLVPQADGKILVGGALGKPGETFPAHLIRLNVDGSRDPEFAPSPSSYVYTLSQQADGRILAGGNFDHLGETPRAYLGQLFADGSVTPDFDLQIDGSIQAVAF